MHLIRPSTDRFNALRRAVSTKPGRLTVPPPEERMAVCGTCQPQHGPAQWRSECEPKAATR